MEILFNELKSKKLDLNISEGKNILKRIALEYFEEIQLNLKHPHYPIGYLQHEKIVVNSFKHFNIFYEGSSEQIHELFLETGIDDEIVLNIIKIIEIFENSNYNTSYDKLRLKFNEFKIELEGSNDWNYILDDTYNIALASFDYWTRNFDKWESEFGKIQLRQSNRLLSVGRADLDGATYGAIIGDGPSAVGSALTSSGLGIIISVFWE
ncbi:hypothetical protein [Membranihabitans marinus]|uniref:hypothetical protein n=1 Tax=Membranihabitans marinus TaxID=1227546 RepID=UPI001F35B430|nr:hypothetical protein [Membranihabitans marinus]